jgi:hypothetical protein
MIIPSCRCRRRCHDLTAGGVLLGSLLRAAEDADRHRRQHDQDHQHQQDFHQRETAAIALRPIQFASHGSLLISIPNMRWQIVIVRDITPCCSS